MITTFSVEDLFNLISGRIPLAFAKVLQNNFKINGIAITKEQWTVLAVLWKKDGCSQQSLADQTNRDKPSITRLLDNLERDNWIERRADASDRRLNLIFLTEKSKSVEKMVLSVVEKTVYNALEGVQEEHIEVMKIVFGKIYDNLQNLK